ncbi:protein starmaker-like [Acanthochromis polyacanthus]|uniref:protein starmaker-like n=1 Tax=Acanthochromis polyacanthus TaxID=80966 RepID=UPI00223411E2|nr:protein starmaker-like [Acanthochromis polyacanthus]
MKKLMSHNSKESNIIEFKGDVFIENKRLLVFEKLDITLQDYVQNLPQPMRLEHIHPENKINLTGLADEDSDQKSSEYEDCEDSSNYKDADYNEDSDVEEEKYRENIKAEEEKDPVNKEINEYEDSDLKSSEYEDCEDSSDYKDADYNEDSDNADTVEHTEDSKDSNDDKDTEVSEKEQRKTKKKKKNCFQRAFSWIKKTFCCCCVSDVMD